MSLALSKQSSVSKNWIGSLRMSSPVGQNAQDRESFGDGLLTLPTERENKAVEVNVSLQDEVAERSLGEPLGSNFNTSRS